MSAGERMGEVTNFYSKIDVAVIRLTKELKLGSKIHFFGHNTDFEQEVTSMQIEHEPVSIGEAGSEVAVKVKQRVHRGDGVFLLSVME
jgi:translation elongation factor EF-1alpha